MSNERFEVVIHHRGYFASDEWCKYVCGETTHWSYDLDRWSYFEILGPLREMGYHSVKGLCYYVEMLLHPLHDDRGALNMVNIARHYGKVHMFVMHGVDEAQVEDNIVESEGGVVRPLESGENSHVVDGTKVEIDGEFEVVGTEIVIRSDVDEVVMNKDTEIGLEEGEVGESLRSSDPEIIAEDVGEGIGNLEIEVVVEDVGEGLKNLETKVGVEDVGAGIGNSEAEDGVEGVGVGVGNPQA